MYCGNFFDVKKPNVGNELNTLFNIPQLNLNNKIIDIDKILELKYDVFQRKIFINGLEGDHC